MSFPKMLSFPCNTDAWICICGTGKCCPFPKCYPFPQRSQRVSQRTQRVFVFSNSTLSALNLCAAKTGFFQKIRFFCATEITRTKYIATLVLHTISILNFLKKFSMFFDPVPKSSATPAALHLRSMPARHSLLGYGENFRLQFPADVPRTRYL